MKLVHTFLGGRKTLQSMHVQCMKIVATYAVLAGLWIVFSDELIQKIFTSTRALSAAQSFKGVFFVVVTSLLLYFLIRNYLLESEKSEASMRAVLDSLSDALLILDEKFEVVEINVAAQRLLGTSREMARTLHEVSRTVHFRNVQGDALSLEEYVKFCAYHPSVVQSTDVRLTLENGRTLSLNMAVSLVRRVSEGQVGALVVSLRDMTDRAAVEEDLKRNLKEAEIANTAKTTFLASVSHELRTPLGAIFGFSELLMTNEPSGEEIQHYSSIINRSTDQLIKIIDDLLDLSKADTGRLEFEWLSFSPSQLLQEVVVDLNGAARNHDNRLSVAVGPEVPSEIVSDPTRLRQILINVIGNAIKFTERGEIRVEVFGESQSATEQTPMLFFRFSDTGVGMNREQQARLFQPFVQASRSTKRKFGGTGLGLSLARRLARGLGGDLVLQESEPGKGSVFLLSLSSAAIPAHLATKEGTDRAASARDGRDRRALVDTKILLVQPACRLRADLETALAEAGAEVSVTDSGVQGIRLGSRHRFDAIVLGAQIPEVESWKASSILRVLGFENPIVCLSSDVSAEQKERYFRAGCEILVKPVFEDIVDVLAEKLPQKKPPLTLSSL